MAEKTNFSNIQLTLLVVLRVLIGWHFLYEGISKLVNPDWSSVAFLLDSKGFLSSFFYSLASNPDVLKVVDFLNIWGLILIGLGLILGLFSRISIIAGIGLLGMYYLSHPPMVGYSFSVPSEGSYLWVNKNLIEMAALAVLLVFPASMQIGFDRFIYKRK
ncbi:MAG TPA: DoxX family membrane protein [Bacteroidetes bacterium]|nr:DoxX family membrane protein [Bacteroidota bacterium]